MAGKTFSDLKKSMSLEDLNKYCYTIANDYARSEDREDREDFMIRYGIKESCFNRIINYAVIHYLVSDWAVKQMEEKAKRNQQRHGASGISSYYHYQKLRSQRRAFAIDMAKFFVENKDKPIEFFIEKYGRSKRGLKYTLEKLIQAPEYYEISSTGVEILADFIRKLETSIK